MYRKKEGVVKEVEYGKTLEYGGFGKIKVYNSPKFGKKVIEKRVGPNFIRARRRTQLHLTTLIKDYSKNEDLLKKESIVMLLMKVGKLDCCVEILDFLDNPFRIIMEYCEGGDLRKILDTYDVPIADKVEMIGQILFALSKIHKFGVIHGDLKCQNIFFFILYIPGQTSKIIIKIGDFGLSELGGDLVYGGTQGFAAPETFKTGGSFESDIYSIGKVMLEIITGYPVEFISTINIRNLFLIKNKLPKLLNVTDFYNIVIPCLDENPKKRPTADALLKLYSSLVLYSETGEKLNNIFLSYYHIGEVMPVDCHKHPLILSNSEMRKSNSIWFCNICRNFDAPFPSNVVSFRCNDCDYDLCFQCINAHNYKNINNKMLEQINNIKSKKVYVKTHIHFLLLSGEDDRKYPKDSYWICDICKATPSSSVYSFHCQECEYDVCLNCYIKNHEQREEQKSCCRIF